MGTFVSEEIVNQIIEADGYGDPWDPRYVKIVQYDNMEDMRAWGAVLDVEVPMKGMSERYEVETQYVKRPKVVWIASDWCNNPVCTVSPIVHRRTGSCPKENLGG